MNRGVFTLSNTMGVLLIIREHMVLPFYKSDVR